MDKKEPVKYALGQLSYKLGGRFFVEIGCFNNQFVLQGPAKRILHGHYSEMGEYNCKGKLCGNGLREWENGKQDQFGTFKDGFKGNNQSLDLIGKTAYKKQIESSLNNLKA